MSNQENYKHQQRLSVSQFFTELPNFIVLAVSALLTGSMIVWMDFIDSLGNVLRTGTVAMLSRRLSRDLRYEYNYGVARLEDIAVLFCDGIVLCGLTIAVVLSVMELADPQRPSGLLVFVVGLKVVNVTVSALFLRGQYKLRKASGGMLAKSTYSATLGMLLFDLVGLVSILLVWAFKNHIWTWYFSPVISILIAGYLGYKCIGRVKKAIAELTDKTLSEDEQMKILKVMTRNVDRYSEFHFVKSHKLGDNAQIDLFLSFAPHTTYEEMVSFKNQLNEQFKAAIENSTINIVI